MSTLELYVILFLLSFFVLRTIFQKTKSSHKSPNKLPPSPLALPIVGHLHLLGPLLHQALHKLSSRYGPLMFLRLGSIHTVVASNPEMAKEFLKTHDISFSLRLHTEAIETLTFNAATPMGPYGPFWIFIKKLSVSELLGTQTLHKYFTIRNKELHQFLKVIMSKSKAGQSVNVTKELFTLTNNTISQMIISQKCLSGQSVDDYEEPVKLVREVTQVFGELNLSDFIWFFKYIKIQGLRKKLEDIKGRYEALLEKIIGDREEARRKRRKSDGGVKDFLDLLLDVLEDKNSEIELGRHHVKGLLMDYLTAGTDSTAVGVEWAVAEMINNPRVFKKAREEIQKVVGTNRLVEELDIPNLPYIQAIMKETLRLHPPIPVILRGSTEECNVMGYTIPKNSQLIVNLWSLGRDPEAWKHPLEFLPERFLPTNENELADSMDVRGQHFELLPFGTGRRICSGVALAMQVMPITLAAMVQCFDWELVKPAVTVAGKGKVVDMTEKPGFTAPLASDLVCVPTTRFSPPNMLYV